MRTKLVLVLVGFLSSFALAKKMPLPAHREPQEDFRHALRRHLRTNQFSVDSPMAVAVPLDQLRLDTLPQWESLEILTARFRQLRDVRFLDGAQPEPGFSHRLSWLYPDDGCWTRSALMIYLLDAWHAVSPKTVFTVGNLAAATKNHPNGRVYWSWHIAPIVAVKNVAYVLDPSVDHAQPLPLKNWVSLQGDPSSIRVAICDKQAFSPQHSCYGSGGISTEEAMNYQRQQYLYYEWYRQIELKRVPEQVLGEKPPW